MTAARRWSSLPRWATSELAAEGYFALAMECQLSRGLRSFRGRQVFCDDRYWQRLTASLSRLESARFARHLCR